MTYRWLAGWILAVCMIIGIVLVGTEPRDAGPQTPPRAEAKSGRIDLRTTGPAFFARYHAHIRTRFDDPARTYAPGYRMGALHAARAAAKAPTRTIDWQERGPANVSGRTRALLVDPGDSTHGTWYAGAVSGGIWKTSDQGQSWRNLTPDLPNLAVAALAQSASNPAVIYAGTGEGFGNPDAVSGDGIWKSTDRGETWSQLAGTATNADFRAVNRLLVHPTDPDVVVAATNEGLFRSTDGGTVWTHTLDRPPSGDGRMQQVIARTAAFDTLYATANGVGVFRSIDAGKTWRLVFDYELDEGRLEVAVAPSDPNRLYLAAEKNQTSELYTSIDAGQTWNEVPLYTCPFRSAPVLTQVNWLGGQGWYNNTLAVHPGKSRELYLGGINIWRVLRADDEQAGEVHCISRLTSPVPGEINEGDCCFPFVHADHHNLTLIPGTRSFTNAEGVDTTIIIFNLFLNANDGGVEFVTGASGLNNPASWRKTTNGYNTTQFYSVDKRPGADQYIGGTQDNGTWRSRAGDTPDASAPWIQQLGGDGFDVSWHADDPRRIMASAFRNELWRSLDGGQRWETATWRLLDREQGSNFITTLAKSQSDPALLFTTGASGVWRTDTFGEWWTLSTLTDPARWRHTGLRTPAAISLADPQVVWAGAHHSDDHRIFVSMDGGLIFDPTNPFPGLDAAVSGLATHPTEPATAYALFSAPGAAKVLRTRDLGVTWEALSGTFSAGRALSSNGFPDVATYTLVAMPFDPEVLWVGTEIGLFISEDGGTSWSRADDGLPAVAIWQMRIVDDQVVMATHGRGVWTATLPELVGYTPPLVTRAPRLNEAAQTPVGGIALTLSLRAPYDSLAVLLDDDAIIRVDGPLTPRDTTLATPPLAVEAGERAVAVAAYRDGRVYRSASEVLTIFPPPPVQIAYANDFSVAVDDFFGEGFTIRFNAGFANNAIHSEHPYPHQRALIYQLSVPIRIAPTNATLRYNDVAIVEPSRPGAGFGENNFFDYVVVEGSRDGITWQPLADGYDARTDATWLAAYENGTAGNASMFVEHTLDLLDTFAPGDVIFLRFRLFADLDRNAWGWAIDDLAIQTDQATAGEEAATLPTRYTLGANYPNPFNRATTLPFTTPRAGPVTLTVYDLQGRRVARVLDGMMPAGTHAVPWDAGSLASGVYVLRLETNTAPLSRLLTLVK